MARDVWSNNTYNYGEADYWNGRYIEEGGSSFDWYQRYSSLRPFVRRCIPSLSSKLLMVGCGNAVMSEDMVKDGYSDIVNIDISSVAIQMMKCKYQHMPQLKYLQMDVRDMSLFMDDSFDSVIDKGTLDSLMVSSFFPLSKFLISNDVCYSYLSYSLSLHLLLLKCGTDAPISASRMLAEVSRLLKPGGVYLLITYGDPNVRMPHLNRPVYNWKIELYIIPRPGFEGSATSALKSPLEPIPLSEKGLLPADFVLEDPDCHFIYVCKKMDEVPGSIPVTNML